MFCTAVESDVCIEAALKSQQLQAKTRLRLLLY